MAPEILRYEKYDARTDLWSIGAILFEMIVGRPPFKAANHILLLQKIEATDVVRFSARILADMTPQKHEAIDLIEKLLKRRPADRIPFDAFFQHPFIVKGLQSSAVAHPGNSNTAAAPSATGWSSMHRRQSSASLLRHDNGSAPNERQRRSSLSASTVRPAEGFASYSSDQDYVLVGDERTPFLLPA